MSKDMIKSMKQTLMCCAQGQMGHLESVDAQELGAVIDMIKDLEEAMYYCVITEAMEKGEKEGWGEEKGHSREYYDPYMYGRMYYPMSINYYSESGKYNPSQGDMKNYFSEGRMYEDGGTMYNQGRMYAQGGSSGGGGSSSGGGGSSGGSSGGGRGGNSSSGGGSRYYHEQEWPYEMMMRDHREGQSPMSRRRYMEAKEMKHDKNTQLQELEKYMKELSHDVVEMIEDASAEEKKYLANKISALATKVSKLEND